VIKTNYNFPNTLNHRLQRALRARSGSHRKTESIFLCQN